MGQDEKIREAQGILNGAIAHLNKRLKCKVTDYKHGNYRVQFLKKDEKPVMPILKILLPYDLANQSSQKIIFRFYFFVDIRNWS